MSFAGLDCSQFPGLPTMAALKAGTNLTFTGFYLAPAPSHGDAGWMEQRAALAAQGWGFCPIFVGQQTIGPGSHNVTAGQGTVDGQHAANLMVAAGFPAGSCVFLDLENGPPFAEPQTGYVTAWAAGVTAAGYAAGVYCSHGMAAEVAAAVPTAAIWAFKVATTASHPVAAPYSEATPSGSGYAAAEVWQHDQNATIEVPGGGSLVVDLSTATSPDPSAP